MQSERLMSELTGIIILIFNCYTTPKIARPAVVVLGSVFHIGTMWLPVNVPPVSFTKDAVQTEREGWASPADAPINPHRETATTGAALT